MIVVLKNGNILGVKADKYNIITNALVLSRRGPMRDETIVVVNKDEWAAIFVNDEDYIDSFTKKAIKDI